MSEPRQRRPRRRRSVTESLASIVLAFEFIVVALAALALFGLRALPPVVALGGGAAVLVLMAVAIALARSPVGIALGWAVQAILIAVVVVEPAVGIAGVLFGAVWTYSMIVGRRIDRRAA